MQNDLFGADIGAAKLDAALQERFYDSVSHLMMAADQLVRLEPLTGGDDDTHKSKNIQAQILSSVVGAFARRWSGRPLQHESAAYLHLPFEDMVEDHRLLDPLNLRGEQIMFMGSFNTPLIYNFVPSQEEGVLFKEFMSFVQALAVASSEGRMLRSASPSERVEFWYTCFREFLIRNPLLSSSKMDEFIAGLLSQGLIGRKAEASIRNRLHFRPESGGDSSDVNGRKHGFYMAPGASGLRPFDEVCAYCGCPAVRTHDKKKAICQGAPWHSTIAHSGTKPAPKFDFVLTRRFLSDIAAAGRPEIQLYDALVERNIKAELFPHEDACDVSFTYKGSRFFVDNKSRTNLKALKEFLKNPSISEKLDGAKPENFYVVVPDALGNERYMNSLREHAPKKGKGGRFVRPDHIMTHSRFLSQFKGGAA